MCFLGSVRKFASITLKEEKDFWILTIRWSLEKEIFCHNDTMSQFASLAELMA